MTTVHIEFHRVQTWLFAVPRLRAMVGANTLLGEGLRLSLPALARRSGAPWELLSATGSYPSSDSNDPLAPHDDPADDAAAGITARDGGHFEAVFAQGATLFAHEAAALLRRELAGLRFRVRIDGADAPVPEAGLSKELPHLSPCEWTGRDLASLVVHQGNDTATVSLEVSRRHAAAKRAANGKGLDLASLLTTHTCLGRLRQPSSFEELAGSGYMAIVHADGNDIGRAASMIDEGARAALFHRNRVLLRRALARTVDAVCGGTTLAPLLLLMLGGDDVLVACRASLALPFVEALCTSLDTLQHDVPAEARVTLGCGVVFARPSLPVYRLHDVAERLTRSAKRHTRAQGGGPSRSTVDWAVYTTAWADDPEGVRRRDWVRGTTDAPIVLSQRPVRVLGDSLESLSGLLAARQKLAGAPRSQLRFLVEQLPLGQRLSDLAFRELSPATKRALADAGVSRVWTQSTSGVWSTALLDLVEVFEIDRLGRSTRETPVAAEQLDGDDFAEVSEDVVAG